MLWSVKNEYLLIKGSVVGPKKRAILITEAIRSKERPHQIQLTYVHQESQQ